MPRAERNPPGPREGDLACLDDALDASLGRHVLRMASRALFVMGLLMREAGGSYVRQCTRLVGRFTLQTVVRSAGE